LPNPGPATIVARRLCHRWASNSTSRRRTSACPGGDGGWSLNGRATWSR
jgi:hypothetical protein